MRQGESASKGKWTGSPSGGVKAPEPIILPAPERRFARTAARLEAISPNHAIEPWLRFMAALARAQAAAASFPIVLPTFDSIDLEIAVQGEMPPLAADGHRRPPEWREFLSIVMARLEEEIVGTEIRVVITDLRRLDAAAIEFLADEFVHGEIAESDAGAVLFIAAALQVYFAKAAASLQVSDLRLLPQRGLCPCCGSTPVAGTITASGDAPGARYLHCSLCSTAWNHVRTICITCGESRSIALEGIEGDAGTVKAETCKDCGTYSKMIYLSKDTDADPYADDLASLGLDLLVAEHGWARHAPNPLLLSGSQA